MKRDKYTCQECGKKQSKAKGKVQRIEVHHLAGIQWEKVIDYIISNVLVDPKNLETVCPECHKKLEEWTG